jgi:hypothetical protein
MPRRRFNWRLWLILTHRWLGIALGIMFVIWSVSGIVLMYSGIPHLSAGERLDRLPPLDLSTATIGPAEAVTSTPGDPFRLRVSMLGDRPVYRINTGHVFGRWTLVFADTGETLEPLDKQAALDWLAFNVPEARESITHAEFLESPDTYTHSPALQTHMPMHRISLNDAKGTEYYVSANSGEAVMKTDRVTRALGISGYFLHTLFFFRQQSWWSPLLNWLSWVGIAMCVAGVAVGILRFGIKKRFKHRGVPSRSPYVGLVKWHHYAGLIFGLAVVIWMFSGLVSLSAIGGIRETLYTPDQIAAGARSVQGEGARIDFSPLTLASVRAAADALGRFFEVKELELINFNGEPYFISYRSPTADELADWPSKSAFDFITPTLVQERAIVSAITPHDGAFTKFSEKELRSAAATAMPGFDITESAWLEEYDDYYYDVLPSFDLGLPRAAKTLPVLRLKFDDPEETWLYLTPSHGQMLKAERLDRRNRWGYYGLHAFDFATIYSRRPLWDLVVLTLLIGVTVLGATTLWPMVKRLGRHSNRLLRKIYG